MTNDKFIINDKGEVVPEYDLLTWARWLESPEGRERRRIAWDEVGEYHVSTVFLGLDYSFFEGPPLLFETMVFENKESEMTLPNGSKHLYNKPLDDFSNRYSTVEEARAGHKKLLKKW